MSGADPGFMGDRMGHELWPKTSFGDRKRRCSGRSLAGPGRNTRGADLCRGEGKGSGREARRSPQRQAPQATGTRLGPGRCAAPAGRADVPICPGVTPRPLSFTRRCGAHCPTDDFRHDATDAGHRGKGGPHRPSRSAQQTSRRAAWAALALSAMGRRTRLSARHGGNYLDPRHRLGCGAGLSAIRHAGTPPRDEGGLGGCVMRSRRKNGWHGRAPSRHDDARRCRPVPWSAVAGGGLRAQMRAAQVSRAAPQAG